MRFPLQGLVFLLLAVMAIVLLFPLASGIWIKQEVEHRMNLRIQAKFHPIFFQPSFELRNVHFQWENRVNLLSGKLRVDYDLRFLLNPSHVRIQITSHDLNAQLLGEWAQIQGVRDVKFDHFYADLGIGQDGIEEIYVLDVQSPVMQLHWGEARPESSALPIVQTESEV